MRGRGGRGRDEGNPPGGRFSQGRAVVEGGAAICSSLGGSSAACVLFIECVVVVIFFPRKCQECGFVFECLWVFWADFHEFFYTSQLVSYFVLFVRLNHAELLRKGTNGVSKSIQCSSGTETKQRKEIKKICRYLTALLGIFSRCSSPFHIPSQ